MTFLVTKVARVARDTFATRRERQLIESSAAIRRERFMVSVAFGSPNASGLITKNPLGLYVNGFAWSRDSMTDGD